MGPPFCDDGSGYFLRFALGSFCDLDPLWLKMFRRMTLQIHVEQAIFKAGASHPDIVRHLETALKTAARDALMQIRRPFPILKRLPSTKRTFSFTVTSTLSSLDSPTANEM